MTFPPSAAATAPSLVAELQARGFIHQCTDLDGLRRRLDAGPLSFYLGFDATADSLHVGHLQALMLMRHLQRAGHRPLLLIGGATTRIGDPSFRDSSRPLLGEAQIAANIAGIARAFGRYLRLGDGPADARVVNNADWLDGIGYLRFLDEVGRHFSVNRLLGFDAVRQRLERGHALSFQEFGYTLLQAHDFAELSRRHGCELQLGGADQWANIINGVELARRQGGQRLYGLTMPLLTTRDGRKMGKSAQGAVWLNADRLAPFDFWQFWRNCDDADVGRFLALFTELPLDEVERLAALRGEHCNEAKRVLAREATRLAHGEAAAQAAEAAAGGVFGACGDAEASAGGLPEVVVRAGSSLAEAIVAAGLQPSRSAVRRLAAGGGLRVDGVPVGDADRVLGAAATPLRVSVGRKQHALIRVAR